MTKRRIIGAIAAAAVLLAGAASPPAPVAAPPPCEGAAAERAALAAERSAIDSAIGDIALGKHGKKRKPGGGEVAAAAAGAAASVLLPFGIGALVGAAGRAAAKGKKKPAPAEPDVPAMIDRLHAIDWRLGELKACG